MKRILFAASECVPFVKTGGLADVIGSLPKTFDRKEYDIRVILPDYHAISKCYRDQMEDICCFQMDDRIYVGVKRLILDSITYYFIDNEQYFSGIVPYYDMFQDLERFAYFSKAVLSSLPLIGFRPDIIHCHDWQSALIPVYLNTLFQGSQFFRGIRTVMTIHNIRFQGTWNTGHIKWITGLPDSCFLPGLLVSPYQDRRYPASDWNCSMLRGGIVYSDYITTVSRSYAEEIQTPEFSDGLDDILRWRRDRLWGILNGIDYSIWNPETDSLIPEKYSIGRFTEAKRMNKTALQRKLKLKEDPEAFTIAMISRLTDQKGLDITSMIIDELCSMNINLIVLGTGERQYEDMLHYFQNRYPDRISANICYDEELAHQIYAGSDALLVPSAFEPCGLTQLIALKYGTVPIVHEIGGLKDTVEPYNQFDDTGTGFTFCGYSGENLLDRIKHAYYVFCCRPDSWQAIAKRGMAQDWSWKSSSDIYRNLYSLM